MISRGASEQPYQHIAPHLNQYMGSFFEKICTEYLWERPLQNDSSFSFLDLASWWVKNPQTKKQEEIDIMGTSGHTSVFGECKRKNELVDTPVLDQLILRSQMFPYVDNHYFLFSKTGFTLACQERAEQLDNVELVTLLIFLRICLKFNFAKSCLLC
ncbi:DUF234 domain-containing protein [Enterococcus cecorum]|uniref:DUF234 domain-containing protein n=1 Tax=Enterococcus cecorum TaxID=44008 RepID=UPI001FAD699E|nr:DUF234 domain-containing protein [Enterococcus cecorum]MCJ0572286.1 DUF234 domain-containing protein [Enterococcus cecorum]MCJ0590912.1 DUF234 domain-containing protein [Enterococcus cecorum]